MAVLVEAISVIVPVAIVSRKWPGGLPAYEAECPNRTFCADEHLTRVGFMSPMDREELVERLQIEGLSLLSEDRFDEIAVVDAALGLSRSCDWLRLGQTRETGIRFCEIAQAAPSDIICVPTAWHHDAEWSYTLDRSIDQMQLHPVQPDGDLDIFFFPVSDGRRWEHYEPTQRRKW